jgi:outer membrane protein
VWATYKQGGRQLLLATAQYEAAEQELLVRVTQTYFDLLSSQDSLEFVKAQKKAVAEQLASAKRNFEVGTATITGVRDAQARYDLTFAQEIAADNDVRIKTLALGLAVGRTDIKAKPLRDNSKLIDPPKDAMDKWVAQSEAMSPAVRQAQLALDVAKLEVDKAFAGHLPTLDGQIVYGGVRNLSGSATSPTSGVSNHVLNPSASLTMSVPLFAGLTTQYRIRETKALEDKAMSDLDNAKRTVAQTTRTAYLGLIAGLSQVKAYEAAEASTQSALDANKLGYSVGVNINIDVLNSQSQLYQTKRDLAKARYDVLVGNLKLRQAAGTLTPQDLQDINQLLAP